MSGPPLSHLCGVSRCHCKGASSTLLNIRTMRAALTIDVTHTSRAIALPLSMQITALGADLIQYFLQSSLHQMLNTKLILEYKLPRRKAFPLR